MADDAPDSCHATRVPLLSTPPACEYQEPCAITAEPLLFEAFAAKAGAATASVRSPAIGSTMNLRITFPFTYRRGRSRLAGRSPITAMTRQPEVRCGPFPVGMP